MVFISLFLKIYDILSKKYIIRSRWKNKERGEILNYFDYRITNGFVEGKNNRIKTIKRTAYGYRNLDNFRLRILATNPGSDVRVSHLLT